MFKKSIQVYKDEKVVARKIVGCNQTNHIRCLYRIANRYFQNFPSLLTWSFTSGSVLRNIREK